MQNAEDLADIPDESVDVYTIAFGIRNCTHVDRVVKEAHRVLKRGGRFMCLEFSHVENPVVSKYVHFEAIVTYSKFAALNGQFAFSRIYDFYSFDVIPALGQMIANDRDSYQYLVESIRQFPTQPAFAKIIRDAGFSTVGKGWEDLTFGVAAIHSGFKI